MMFVCAIFGNGFYAVQIFFKMTTMAYFVKEIPFLLGRSAFVLLGTDSDGDGASFSLIHWCFFSSSL